MPAGISWGRWPRYEQQIIHVPDRFSALPQRAPMLPYGNGRSYGDVCLNAHGALLVTRHLDRFISFDAQTGILECEAGVLLSEITALTLKQGWFPAVTPGTAFITVGGAIANDVHGKNHHRAGSFGHHLLSFELKRSNGQTLHCSATQNSDWFNATIGGLGLTGLISTARLQLRRVPGPWIAGDSLRFGSLRAFFDLAAESDKDYEYTAAWIDCAATGRKMGRGVFTRGNHVAHEAAPPRERAWKVPMAPPFSPMNAASIKVFNELIFHRPSAHSVKAIWHYQPFLYPLDSIRNWNLLYGPKGFLQYQCVLPHATARDALPEMMQLIARSRQGSFLVVLKQFGNLPSLGWLSFPRPGATLALDFPNRGVSTLQLLDSLDKITCAAGGAVYPAKDARMSARSYQQYFPAWDRMKDYIDPRFSSSFWRRVTGSVSCSEY